ncbi:hypothetical protein TWF506_003224 [Arthrobotrys conoides]|uniref:Uncharacterized protein n=1 Tax=Arthrobotrys conoides TaxID=74498 RepID=A0AAN8RR22_9PEZI
MYRRVSLAPRSRSKSTSALSILFSNFIGLKYSGVNVVITARWTSRSRSFFAEGDIIQSKPVPKYSQSIDIKPYIVGESETDFRSIILSSLFVKEFELGGIRFSDLGLRTIQNVCSSFYPEDLYEHTRQYCFEQCLQEEIGYKLTYDPILSQLDDIWIDNQIYYGRPRYLIRRYEDYKVYVMWESLYYRTSYLHDLIEDAEISGDSRVDGDEVTFTTLWNILRMMYNSGLLVKGDVDRLPDPMEYYLPLLGDNTDSIRTGQVIPAIK